MLKEMDSYAGMLMFKAMCTLSGPLAGGEAGASTTMPEPSEKEKTPA